MTKISFDEEKAIFNDGNAGVVANCTFKVEKRKPTDPSNYPNYKLIVIDPNNGAIVNKPFYYEEKFKSDRAQQFFKNEMRHLLKICKVENPKKEFDTYSEMLDYVMEQCRDKASDTKVNVVVDYGTSEWPKRYLQLNGFPWYINSIDKPMPSLRNTALQVRPIPDSDEEIMNDSNSADNKAEEDGWV